MVTFTFIEKFYLKFIIWLVDGGVMQSGGKSKSRRTDKIYSRRRPPAITMLQLTFSLNYFFFFNFNFFTVDNAGQKFAPP